MRALRRQKTSTSRPATSDRSTVGINTASLPDVSRIAPYQVDVSANLVFSDISRQASLTRSRTRPRAHLSLGSSLVPIMLSRWIRSRDLVFGPARRAQ